MLRFANICIFGLAVAMECKHSILQAFMHYFITRNVAGLQTNMYCIVVMCDIDDMNIYHDISVCDMI